LTDEEILGNGNIYNNDVNNDDDDNDDDDDNESDETYHPNTDNCSLSGIYDNNDDRSEEENNSGDSDCDGGNRVIEIIDLTESTE
jgi:hypothetical protein